MDPSKFAGLSWDVWANHVETLNEDQMCHLNSNSKKLLKADKKIFGVLVDADPLKLVRCEQCCKIVKPAALLEHYALRHFQTPTHENVTDKHAPQLMAKAESLIKPTFDKTSVTLDSDLISEAECSENTKKKGKFVSPCEKTSKRFKMLETKQSRREEMCANRQQMVKKTNEDNKHRAVNTQTDLCVSRKDKMESDTAVDDLEQLSKRLPELSLRSTEEERTCSAGSSFSSDSDSLVYSHSPPRALGRAPLFLCHRAGGLLYHGRQMKMARHAFQQMLDDEIHIPAKLIQQLNARRKNIFNRKKK